MGEAGGIEQAGVVVDLRLVWLRGCVSVLLVHVLDDSVDEDDTTVVVSNAAVGRSRVTTRLSFFCLVSSFIRSL